MSTRAAVLLCVLLARLSTAGAENLPDPTRPPDFEAYVPVSVARQLGDWEVNGITVSATARSAILNGIVVVPGQRVGAARVVDILPREVVLDIDGEILTVRLPRLALKKAVNP